VSPHSKDAPPPSPVTANLIAEMARTGATNTEVARALGVSERQITRWRGGQAASYRFVLRLAAYFGRRPEWFYTDHTEDDNGERAA
jgi:plasmid maintenance system antidote protein VapI